MSYTRSAVVSVKPGAFMSMLGNGVFFLMGSCGVEGHWAVKSYS